MPSNLYDRVRSIQFPRAPFDLSHSHQGSYEMGKLYPVMAEEAVPGDLWKLGTQIVARCLPLVAPIMHEINLYVHYWFVPYRLLWPKPLITSETPDTGKWVDFITGGKDGNNSDTQPLWMPDVNDLTVGSLWDHFGHPMTACTGFEPTAFHKRAYNFIYNENYRDENLIDPVSLDDQDIKGRAWEKDYFTSALPFQQRGTAPALPVSGLTSAVWAATSFQNGTSDTGVYQGFLSAASSPFMRAGSANGAANALDTFNDNVVDLSSATSVDIAQLREAIQTQRWLERNARGGYRYTEFLTSHYKASPRDDRLQRPEYIGGTKQPIIISEVLQTSETATTPQGEMAGHGLTVGGETVGHYRVLEHGVILGIMSIMPRTMYTQGMTRTFVRRSRYEYYFPEFANLSEQAILAGELYASTSSGDNNSIFGYQGRYDELRQRNSRAVGLMREPSGGLAHWNLARTFGSLPGLNQSFIEVESNTLKSRCWAVPSQPAFVVTIGNIMHVNRPLPEVAEPGMMDHI